MEFVTLWLLVVIEKISSILLLGDHLIWLGLILVFGTPLVMYVRASSEEQLDQMNQKSKSYRSWGWAFIVVGVISYGIGSILPNQKEMAIIVGGGITYNILTSNEAKEVGGKSLQLLNKKLDELLERDEVKPGQ